MTTQVQKDALVLLKTQERDAAAVANTSAQAAATATAAALIAAQLALEAALAIVVDVPPPGPGTFAAVFTKYPTEYKTSAPVVDTEAEDTTWGNPAYDAKRNCFYMIGWQAIVESFGQARDAWVERTPRLGAGVHNRTLVVDPVNDRLLIGTGSGLWYNPGTTTYMTVQPRVMSIDLTLLESDPSNVAAWFLSANVGTTKGFGTESAAHVDLPRSRLVIFGGWENFGTRTMPLNPYGPTVNGPAGGPKWAYAYPDSEPGFTGVQRMTQWCSGVDSQGRSIYIEPRGRLWICPHGTLVMEQHATTGDIPPQLSQYTIDPRLDCVIAWSGGDGQIGGSAGNAINELRVMPLDTKVWTKVSWTGPTPVHASYVSWSIVDDPGRAAQLLHITAHNWGNIHSYELKVTRSFSLPAPGNGGTVPPIITPPPVDPPPVGTVRFTSIPVAKNPLAPYGRPSKHTAMALFGDELIVGCGDWIHSATDGMWAVNIKTGAQRLVVGDPIYPTRPAPHALQDGCGFEFVNSRQEFLLWPGIYSPYTTGAPTGTNWVKDFDALLAQFPKLHFSRGMFWLNPVTWTFKQDLSLFGTPGASSGCNHGGVFDQQTNNIVALRDASSGYSLRCWNIDTAASTTTAMKMPPFPTGTSVAYFQRNKYALIGRWLYFVGYATIGTRPSQRPMFWRVNLDTSIVEALAPPPITGASVSDGAMRLAHSNGKVVFVHTVEPDGTVIALLIYDPATNVWTEHTERPVGNFVGNSVASLDGRRVALAGALGAVPQTHVHLIEA